jgi:hypothetical protein
MDKCQILSSAALFIWSFLVSFAFTCAVVKAPAVCKFHPITSREGTEGEWGNSSTLSLISALDGVGG